jgi:hypothetical protein
MLSVLIPWNSETKESHMWEIKQIISEYKCYYWLTLYKPWQEVNIANYWNNITKIASCLKGKQYSCWSRVRHAAWYRWLHSTALWKDIFLWSKNQLSVRSLLLSWKICGESVLFGLTRVILASLSSWNGHIRFIMHKQFVEWFIWSYFSDSIFFK